MKRCTLCKIGKPLTDFNRKRSSSDGHQNVCRECNRGVSRDYYRRNRAKHRRVVAARNRRVRRENERRLLAYLATHPCVDCGETDVVVLEFDHVRGKRANVSVLVRRRSSWKRVAEEIGLCDVRCVNCHRRRTFAVADTLRRRLLAGSAHESALAGKPSQLTLF